MYAFLDVIFVSRTYKHSRTHALQRGSITFVQHVYHFLHSSPLFTLIIIVRFSFFPSLPPSLTPSLSSSFLPPSVPPSPPSPLPLYRSLSLNRSLSLRDNNVCTRACIPVFTQYCIPPCTTTIRFSIGPLCIISMLITACVEFDRTTH